MSADALLSKLDHVRSTGRGRWLACCPAHADRSPSLAVRELDDGRTLLHCFSGCDVAAVLNAVGLGFDALFPERPVGDRAPRERRPFAPMDILQAVAFEALVAATAASRIAQDLPLTDADRARLWTATGRLRQAVEIANGR